MKDTCQKREYLSLYSPTILQGPNSPTILKNILCLFSKDFVNLNETQLYGLANQKLCYIQMLLNIENSGEHYFERFEEWLVNMHPEHN